MTKKVSPKSLRRAAICCGLALAGMFSLAVAGSQSARADWDGHGYRHWHGGYRDDYRRGWWGPRVVVTAPGYYYAPRPREYYPPAYVSYPAGVGIYFPIR